MKGLYTDGISFRDLVALESFKIRLSCQLTGHTIFSDTIYEHAYEDADAMLNCREEDDGDDSVN